MTSCFLYVYLAQSAPVGCQWLAFEGSNWGGFLAVMVRHSSRWHLTYEPTLDSAASGCPLVDPIALGYPVCVSQTASLAQRLGCTQRTSAAFLCSELSSSSSSSPPIDSSRKEAGVRLLHNQTLHGILPITMSTFTSALGAPLPQILSDTDVAG